MLQHLKHPIVVGELRVDRLEYPERMRVRHLIAGDGHVRGTEAYEIAVISALTSVPELALRELDIEDYAAAEVLLERYSKNFAADDPRALPSGKDPTTAPTS